MNQFDLNQHLKLLALNLLLSLVMQFESENLVHFNLLTVHLLILLHLNLTVNLEALGYSFRRRSFRHKLLMHLLV